MKIQIKNEKVPHFEGLALYMTGKKAHLGVFVSLQAMRQFWHKYQVVLCAGWIQVDFVNWKKA